MKYQNGPANPRDIIHTNHSPHLLSSLAQGTSRRGERAVSANRAPQGYQRNAPNPQAKIPRHLRARQTLHLDSALWYPTSIVTDPGPSGEDGGIGLPNLTMSDRRVARR